MKRWLHVALPVLVGGLVYCAFRTTDHLLFRWLDAFALAPVIDGLRQAAAPWRPENTWVLYSLPDGLWLYAFAYAMRSLWTARGEGSLWRAAPLALALGSEFAQALSVLQGTFDPLDVATYIGFYGLARLTA